MKRPAKKDRYCYDLLCKNCGMEISVKTLGECPGDDVIFICCGESMKVKK